MTVSSVEAYKASGRKEIIKDGDKEVTEKEVKLKQRKDDELGKVLSNIGKKHGHKDRKRAHENSGTIAGNVPEKTLLPKTNKLPDEEGNPR